MFAALAPILAFIFLVTWVRTRCPCWRMSFLVAAVLWGVTVVALTEGLSALHAFSFPGVLMLWLMQVGWLAWLAWRHRVALAGIWIRPAISIEGSHWVLVSGISGMVGVLGALALVAPPNTDDSMTYHMSRVAHWIQNATVAHYPTWISRQLHMAPGAEFIIAQLQILSGGDRFANLVQWSSMLCSLIGVSLVAKQLGGNGTAQILATVVAATIPMGILEATSTQNDYAVTAWLVCLVVFVLRLGRPPSGKEEMVWALLVGGALGLALLTKATAYLFALPFLGWMGGRIRQDGVRAWRILILVGAMAAAVNAGHYWRNLETYGWPLGPGHEEGLFVYSNASVEVRSFMSLIARNVGLHFGSLANGPMVAVHRLLGLDVDDPATTWPTTSFLTPRRSFHEDTAGNAAHAVLAMGSLIAVASVSALRRRDQVFIYAGALVAGFALFSLVLRWQPWHSRLELPLFVLGAPVVGIVLAQWPRLGHAVAITLLLAAVPWLIFNETKPLVGGESAFHRDRETQYFLNRLENRRAYTEAMAQLKSAGCSAIGLTEVHWEYPLWVVAERVFGPERFRIEHVGQMRLGGSGRSGFEPCGIVMPSETGREVVLDGRRYSRVLLSPPIGVFMRDGDSEARYLEGGGARPAAALDMVALLQHARAGAFGMSAEGYASIQLSATAIRAGEALRVGIEVRAPASGPPSLVSVGVVDPDRHTVRFVSAPGRFTRRREVTDLRDLVALRIVDPGATWRDAAVINVVVPSGTPVGTYSVFAVLTHESGLRALAADVATVEVAP